MKVRKRIAWAALCCVAGALIVVMWARSYWYADVLWFKVSESNLFYVISERGRWGGIVLPASLTSGQGSWWFGHVNAGGGYELETQDGRWLFVPYWFICLLVIGFGAMPWISWRFGLRTLLIIATLVALVMGLVAWAVR